MGILSVFKKLFSKKISSNMQAEIFEQPEVVRKLLKKYVSKDGNILIDLPENFNRVALIASGSSYHSATIAANFLRNYVNCDAQSYYSSEFSLFENINIDENTLYIFLSQSGETSDTNKALNIVKAKTNKTMAMVNTKDSTLYNNAKYKLLNYAGVEKSIASTKAVCSQIFCLLLIAVKLMQQKDMPVDTILKQLNDIPVVIQDALNKEEKIQSFAKKLMQYDNAAVLASGVFYPLSKECALKIKETSYINTTAYPTGEFLHGHIAILNKKCAVIAIVNNVNVEFTVNVLDKINNEYDTDVLVISAFNLNIKNSQNVICVNEYSDIEFLFSSLIILQLLALKNATLLNRNVDAPTGLSKVVK